VEFVGAFPLSQTFRLQILGPLRLLLSFQKQRTDHRCQRGTVLRKILLVSVHRSALTIDAIAVSFSDQYFFFIFLADSCVAWYPLQFGNINAVQNHG
jgi:hypothetical protein